MSLLAVAPSDPQSFPANGPHALSSRDVSEIDVAMFRFVHGALSGPGVLWIMAALTVLGNGWTMIAFVPLLVRAQTRRFGSALLATLLTTSLAVLVVKEIVGRARPCRCLAGVCALVFEAPRDYSFPSGHAAGAFAFATFVALALARASDRANDPPAPRMSRPLRRGVTVALFVVAAGIGASRVALGVHFPGDVAAGALLGAVLGALGARLHRQKARSEQAQL